MSLLDLPGFSARGLRSGSMLGADSTRIVALCLLSDVSRRVWGRQERSYLDGSLTPTTQDQQQRSTPPGPKSGTPVTRR